MIAAGVAYLTRGAREVTVDQAVDEFRSNGKTTSIQPQATATAAASSARAVQPSSAPTVSKTSGAAAVAPAAASNAFAPAGEGVYTFETSGYEETDALSGQRHDYPKETSLTVRRLQGSVWMNRWQPLKERWEESEFVEHPQGTEMRKYTMYHEFFRRGQTETYSCPGGYVQKPNVKPGDSWTFVCRSPNSRADAKVTVIGYDTLLGTRATHYRYEITASGANHGHLTQDRWFTDGPRTMARWTQKADLTTQSPFGPVGYKESFSAALKSLQPRT